MESCSGCVSIKGHFKDNWIHSTNHWAMDLKKKLQSVSCPDGTKVAKEWLIEFIAAHIISHPAYLPPELKK